jgi:hypothetical protein
LVYHNVRELVNARNRLGRSTPIITWRFLMFEHNVHEIPLAIEGARELGVDQFSADAAWDVSWDDPEIRPATAEPVRLNFKHDFTAPLVENWNPFANELDEDAIERDYGKRWVDSVGVNKVEPPSPERKDTATTCQWLYKSITLDAGGRIFPCCCSPRPNADLTFSHFDVDSEPASIFNSEKHQLSRLFFADPQKIRLPRLRPAWTKTRTAYAANGRKRRIQAAPRSGSTFRRHRACLTPGAWIFFRSSEPPGSSLRTGLGEATDHTAAIQPRLSGRGRFDH